MRGVNLGATHLRPIEEGSARVLSLLNSDVRLNQSILNIDLETPSFH